MTQADEIRSLRIGRNVNTSPNIDIAGRLDEVANIFAEQGANRFRVQAYRKAANVLRRLPRSVADIFKCEGIEGLEKIPGVGPSIARSIRDILLHGRLAMLDRLRGESEAIAVLASVPGVGKKFARRFHDDLGIETLEELEVAAHDGRIEKYPGIGAKRLAGIRDSLAQRLGRIRRRTTSTPPPRVPSVSELLDVDFEYREKAKAGTLGADRTASFQSGRRILASHSSHRAKRASLHGAVFKHCARP